MTGLTAEYFSSAGRLSKNHILCILMKATNYNTITDQEKTGGHKYDHERKMAGTDAENSRSGDSGSGAVAGTGRRNLKTAIEKRKAYWYNKKQEYQRLQRQGGKSICRIF